MISKQQRQDWRLGFLESCGIDYTGLWKLPWHLRDIYHVENDKVVKKSSLALLRDLLVDGLVVVGDLDWDSGKLSAWNLPVDEIISRIDLEWAELGRDPDLLEIAWVTTTEKGDRYLEKML